jgi:hypothetical protein
MPEAIQQHVLDTIAGKQTVIRFQVLQSEVGSWPYTQTLDYADLACLGTNTLAYYKY